MSSPRPTSPDPRVRLAVALGALALVLSAPRPAPALVVAAAAALHLAARGLLRARAFLPALLLGLPAAALAAWLGADGHLVGPVTRAAWPAGIARGALVLSRVLSGSLVLAWLTAGLRMAELTGALAAVSVPALLLDLLVLAGSQRRVLRRAYETARDAHALRPGQGGPWRAIAASGVLAGAVASRAIERSSTLGDAIQLRGGVADHRLPAFRPARADLVHLLAGAALLGVVAWLSWGRPW